MDINHVSLSGRIFNIGVNETRGEYPVVEAKLLVNIGTNDEGTMYDEFYIRSYGKKSLILAELKENTFVTITGRLKEDIRVNSFNPSTKRSKTYINIDNIKTFENK